MANNSHPLTKTNNNNLRGKESTVGGNIKTPKPIRTVATAMSIIKKGRYKIKTI